MDVCSLDKYNSQLRNIIDTIKGFNFYQSDNAISKLPRNKAWSSTNKMLIRNISFHHTRLYANPMWMVIRYSYRAIHVIHSSSKIITCVLMLFNPSDERTSASTVPLSLHHYNPIIPVIRWKPVWMFVNIRDKFLRVQRLYGSTRNKESEQSKETQILRFKDCEIPSQVLFSFISFGSNVGW